MPHLVESLYVPNKHLTFLWNSHLTSLEQKKTQLSFFSFSSRKITFVLGHSMSKYKIKIMIKLKSSMELKSPKGFCCLHIFNIKYSRRLMIIICSRFIISDFLPKEEKVERKQSRSSANSDQSRVDNWEDAYFSLGESTHLISHLLIQNTRTCFFAFWRRFVLWSFFFLFCLSE